MSPNFWWFLFLINSRLGFSAGHYRAPNFLQFKEFELFWGAVFLRLEENYWRSPFFNQFYWSQFWSGKWNTWRNLESICRWTKWRVERKESGFLLISLFSREREIEEWKKFCKRAEFFVHVRHLKVVFFIFLVKRFGYDFVLILGWFW